jgi:beta-lactamase superfamily II metal-dependent hydrolase
MDDKLLVRVYNVGFGDCIFVQVPDRYRDEGGNNREDLRSILIDLGTNSKWALLRKILHEDIAPELPIDAQSGRRLLDLLVVTHPHKDHFNGFDPAWFQDIKIKRIWLSVFMKADHPQAKKGHALQALADQAARSLLPRPGIQLGAGIRDLLMNSVYNDDAMTALREQLSQASGIYPQYPLYVCRDIAYRLSADERKKYGLKYEQRTTCHRFSQTSDTRIRVLAPEWDIDRYYVGDKALDCASLCSTYGVSGEPPRYQSFLARYEEGQAQAVEDTVEDKERLPKNISVSDFRRLRERLLYSALAFSQADDDLKNNTSVVLLLEWRNRRLLFAADAEWGGGYHEGESNSSWDVALKKDTENPEDARHLSTPVDFLKLGHHGSINGTPWNSEAGAAAEQAFLDQLVGKPSDQRRAKVVVSTRFGSYGKQKEVPYRELMRQLGLRSSITRDYDPDEAGEDRVQQPLRTDKEFPDALENLEVKCIRVEIHPDPAWAP